MDVELTFRFEKDQVHISSKDNLVNKTILNQIVFDKKLHTVGVGISLDELQSSYKGSNKIQPQNSISEPIYDGTERTLKNIRILLTHEITLLLRQQNFGEMLRLTTLNLWLDGYEKISQEAQKIFEYQLMEKTEGSIKNVAINNMLPHWTQKQISVFGGIAIIINAVAIIIPIYIFSKITGIQTKLDVNPNFGIVLIIALGLIPIFSYIAKVITALLLRYFLPKDLLKVGLINYKPSRELNPFERFIESLLEDNVLPI